MKLSSGLLLYRIKDKNIEVLLVHPGGPFWARKDAWGIPKGEYPADADPLESARREFEEELGSPAPEAEFIDLGEVKASGKAIRAWAAEGDLDTAKIVSNTFEMEWPPRSGKMIEAPEVDRANWFEISHAASKIHKGQQELLERLANKLNRQFSPSPEQSSLF